MTFMKKFFDGFKMENQGQNSNIPHRKLSILEADAKLKRANELANIANKTTDREEFYNSINEIKDILRELAKYEGKLPFIGSPSADLRNLERNEQSQIELLEKRISEKNKKIETVYNSVTDKENPEKKYFDLDNFARECNNYLENQDVKVDCQTTETQTEINEVISPPAPKTKKKSHDLLKCFQPDGLDPYFVEAGRFIIEKDKASIGMIQRVFKIGFNRSARIIDQLEEYGVVGPEYGTKPRLVLMTAEMFEQCIKNIISESEGNEQRLTKEIQEQDTSKMLKDKFDLETDYSNDGESLKYLKNMIIPSVSNEIQLDFINTLLKCNSPETIKLILIDDSIINYSVYNDVPQLLIPVVTDTRKINSVFDWCCAEMECRINNFVEYRVKNIDSFNEKMKQLEENTYPRIVCITNEAKNFFDKTYNPLERLFMNSNMVGIYFILFSRFSLKRLSLGIIGELLETFTADKLRMLLSKTENKNGEQHISRNFDTMDGYQFERFCADVLRQNGFENVEVTQGSGDHGIDILAEKDDITYAIQCKCYSTDIGNAAIQQAHSGKEFYQKDIAVVITNRYFTSQAIEEANALRVKLWDRAKLNEMIGRRMLNEE